MKQYIKYVWQHSILKPGYIGALICACIGILLEVFLNGLDKTWEQFSTSALTSIYGILIWIMILICFHGSRAPLAIKIKELEQEDKLGINKLSFTIKQKNKLISDLKQYANSSPKVVLSSETGQQRNAEELYMLLHSSGWNVEQALGAANGFPPGLNIEAHDDDDIKVLFSIFSDLGIRVNKLIHTNHTKGRICLTVGEIY